MCKKLSKGSLALIVVFLVIAIDQISKIWVKTNMSLYEAYEITSWFKIYFVENNGMAFGIEAIAKVFLSLFRIVAVFFISIYLYRIVKQQYKRGFITSVALVLSGAFGNIIDSLFYGVFFSESLPGKVASVVPMGEGYAGWLHGKVVDMFYFPLFDATLPTWVPFIGGDNIEFFPYVFNVADSAISVGVFILMIFYRKTLSKSLQKNELSSEKDTL